MKAFILVGGYGTRLRPLTFGCPKSPMLEHEVEALSKLGVNQIIFNFNFQVSENLAGLEKLEKKYGIKMTYSKEEEAVGTAGPLKYAEEIINKDNKEGIIFVFNADIICDYPLSDLLKFHRAHGKEGSIVLAKVADPSRFGVVITDESNKVLRFVEKSQEFISDKINAGIYLFNTSIIKRIPKRFCMLEKEIFPKMAEEGELYAMTLSNNFWYDIGQPKDYLIGQGEYLKYYKLQKENDARFQGNVLVHETAKIQEGALIGPNVVIGAGCVIGPGARLKNCTLFQNTTVGGYSYVSDCIISWRCKLGDWSRIEGLTVLAQDVEVKQGVRVTSAMVLPQKSVGSNLEAGSIIM